MEYLDNKRNPSEEEHEITDEESLKRLYKVFGGSVVKGSSGIDLDKSLILSYYEVEDYNLYTSIGILTFYMVALKVMTYYVLLAKLHAAK